MSIFVEHLSANVLALSIYAIMFYNIFVIPLRALIV